MSNIINNSGAVLSPEINEAISFGLADKNHFGNVIASRKDQTALFIIDTHDNLLFELECIAADTVILVY